jgi:hypothetical protein
MEKETVVLRVAQQLLDDARKELARADEKASSALGTVSALIAVTVVAPRELQFSRQTFTWGWACGLSTCALAVILLMLAVLPRFTTRSRNQVPTYFGDVAQVRHQHELGHLLGQLGDRSSDALLTELRAISKIVVIKYRFTRLGILCAATGAALLTINAIR